MENSAGKSFFQDIRSRELNGFRVRKRPYIAPDSSEFNETGAIAFEHNSADTPPMALSFCKTREKSHILAVAGEDGYVSLYNTRLNFPSSATHNENAERARICDWVAHYNAIFDVCWIKEDTNLLTACGDHSVKVWDPEGNKCLAALMGHTGSVKSISSHPTNTDLIVSGSRDGSFAIWDLRSSKSTRVQLCISPIDAIQGAHALSHGRQGRRGKKVGSMSTTSVLYLKDEVSIATAGAVDSVIKFWDTRHLRNPVNQACPSPKSSNEKGRSHGVSSLSQDLNGVHLSASCMDSRIYLYNILQLEKGPIKTFSGGQIDSFFVKSAISPDARHILSGSSDGNAYIWQVNKPEADPSILRGHDGEVTAVDWCSSQTGKIATSADDFTVRFWDIKNCFYSNTRSPSSIRRRVMAPPKLERRKVRKLFIDEELENSANEHEVPTKINSHNLIMMPEMKTPEGQKKRFSFCSDVKETCERSPDAALSSPSSVLNPPSSLKRKTIRDYFLLHS